MKPLDPAARASRPAYDVHPTENVMIPMRDGVRMATTFTAQPATAGRSPTAAPSSSTAPPTTRWRPRPPRASAATSPLPRLRVG